MSQPASMPTSARAVLADAGPASAPTGPLRAAPSSAARSAPGGTFEGGASKTGTSEPGQPGSAPASELASCGGAPQPALASATAPATPAPSAPDASEIPWESFAPQRMAELADRFAACRGLLVALGDANRQLIFMELLRHWGGMRVGEVTACTNLSRPAVSHHLKILREAGLVDMYEVGTKNFYHASPGLAQWTQLLRLTSEAEGFVRELVRREAAGAGCGHRTE